MAKKHHKAVEALRLTGLTLLAAVTLAVAVFPRISGYKWLWVRGPSVNVTLGLLQPVKPAELKAGDYVMLKWRGTDPNHIPRLLGETNLIKKVSCLPGQRLTVTMQQADCDGVKIGHIRHTTLDGKPITPALHDGVIPQGQLFLVGEHYYSYDSRYFGLVNLADLTGIVRVLL